MVFKGGVGICYPTFKNRVFLNSRTNPRILYRRNCIQHLKTKTINQSSQRQLRVGLGLFSTSVEGRVGIVSSEPGPIYVITFSEEPR